MIKPSSKPWPRSMLPKPRPVDWGIGMTVCVVGMEHLGGLIIAASDMMVSTGDMATDWAAIKFASVGKRWHAMFAGGDLSPVTSILGKATEALAGKPENLEDVVNAMTSAYASARNRKAEQLYLTPLGLTLDSFRKERRLLGPTAFANLINAVQGEVLDLMFLVYGFDEKKLPHIFGVRSPGYETIYDQVGFWAIGCGETAALGSLFNAGHNMFEDGPSTLYRMCEAKFVAESVPAVGEQTIVQVVRSDGSSEGLGPGDIEPMKDIWKAHRRIEIPADGKKLAANYLKP